MHDSWKDLDNLEEIQMRAFVKIIGLEISEKSWENWVYFARKEKNYLGKYEHVCSGTENLLRKTQNWNWDCDHGFLRASKQ